MATATTARPGTLLDQKINVNPGRWGALVFGLALIAGAIYSGWSLMATILAAYRFGLLVSTTHVLASGVAGTMAANHSGLQWSTIRSLLAAWVLTLPASIALSAGLYWLFRQIAH